MTCSWINIYTIYLLSVFTAISSNPHISQGETEPLCDMFKWPFPRMCDTRLTSYTISLLINVEFCSIGELNVLCFFFLQICHPCLSVKFVTDGHTVGRKWFTSCGDLASWSFFIRVSILITSGWVLVAMITPISLALLYEEELVMCTDKHCGTEK